MRRTPLALIILLASVLAIPAFAGETSSAENQRFGAPVVEKKAANIGKLAKKPASFAGRTLRIEGVVKDVCQGMGCWVEVQDEKGVSFMARSLDESVLVPKDIKGRRIVVQGVIKPLPRAQAEEPKPEGHACPRPEYVLATEGVELP
jgi:hypothetical protein